MLVHDHDERGRSSVCKVELSFGVAHCLTTASPYQLAPPTDGASYGVTLRYNVVETLEV